MIEVKGARRPRMAAIDLVPPALTAGLTRFESSFSAPC
jgi:hypothetical protein